MIVPSALKASHEIIRTPTTTSEPVDLVALARTIVEHAPSLRFVALDLSSAPGGSASKSKQAWFRVYDVGKQRKVEQVPESEGREMQRKMRSFNRWD